MPNQRGGSAVIDEPTTDEHILELQTDLGTLEADLNEGEGVPIRVTVDVTAICEVDGAEPITLQFSESTFGDRRPLSPSQAWRLARDLDTAGRFVGQTRQDAGFGV